MQHEFYKKYVLVPHTDSRKYRVYTPSMVLLGDYTSRQTAILTIGRHIKGICEFGPKIKKD